MKTLDSKQAAEHLGISIKTLLQMARDGSIPGYNWGNSWTFVQEQLDEWLLDNIRRQHEERLTALIAKPAADKSRHNRKALIQ